MHLACYHVNDMIGCYKYVMLNCKATTIFT